MSRPVAPYSDERERAYWSDPKASAERTDQWKRWVENYAVGCVESWAAAGEEQGQAIDAAASIICDWQRIDTEPWMPVGPALMQLASAALLNSGGPLDGDARVDYMRAIRTLETTHDSERTLALAYQLGLTTLQTRNLTDRVENNQPVEANDGAETALYRHFDADGVLLYIGIAAEPNIRSEQHRYHSPWYRFVADTVIEWHETRDLAQDAEREAIRDERPIFNLTHNKANSKAAVTYLFEAFQVTA